MAGRFIFRKRHDLRAFNVPVEDLPLSYPGAYDPPASTSIKVTREFASLPSEPVAGFSDAYLAPNKDGRGGNGRFSELSTSSMNKSYTVNVTSTPTSPPSRPSLPHMKSSASSTGRGGHNRHANRAAMEANRAAYSYTFIASLFFVSLLVTWVPSSINRVYSLIHPEAVSVEYAYAAGVVLSLMGFWNSVIYIATSWMACKNLFAQIFLGGSGRRKGTRGGNGRAGLVLKERGGYESGKSGRGSWGDRSANEEGDSIEGLAVGEGRMV